MDAARLSKIVTPKREKVIKDCFLEWDKGKKGFLNKHETNCAFLELFGCKLIQSELEKLFEDGKEEGVEDESNEVVVGLAFAKFDQAVREKFYLQDRDEEIRNAFKAFDTQGLGYISREVCLETFRTHASFVPSKVVDLVFDEVDIDRDGKISYRDFVKVWNNNVDELQMSSEYALTMNKDLLWSS